jgi:hypothetical protein
VSSPAIYTGVEDVVGAVRRLGLVATMGDIHDKRAAYAAYSAVFSAAATAMQSLSMAMQEPGQHYGPEMAEPAAKAAALATAAASASAEGESAVKVFLDARVGELRDSGRTVPHHDQLSGAGT